MTEGRTKKETGLSLGCTNKLCSTTNVNRLFMDLKLLLTNEHNVIFKCIARCISRVLIKWRKMKTLKLNKLVNIGKTIR